MALKTYFTGKTGLKFWANIILMVLVIVAVPVVTFYLLDAFTHHGEKIEVPSVLGKSLNDAEGMLTMRTLARNMSFLMRSIALGKAEFGLPAREPWQPTHFIRSDLTK